MAEMEANQRMATIQRQASPESLPSREALRLQWTSCGWKAAERLAMRLQARIAKAAREKKWNKAKRLHAF
jgi:hypothetical protein